MESENFNGCLLVNNVGMGTGFDIEISSGFIEIDNMNVKLSILDSSLNDERAIVVAFKRDDDEIFWLFRFNNEYSEKMELSKKIFSTFKFIEKRI